MRSGRDQVRGKDGEEEGREGGKGGIFSSFAYLVCLPSFWSTVRNLRQRRDSFLPLFLPLSLPRKRILGPGGYDLQADVGLGVGALLDADPLGGGEELREGGREGGREEWW